MSKIINSNLNNSGIAGDSLEEPIPEFNNRTGDIVFNNKNNAWIVLGRDRPTNRVSGYGGMPAPMGLNAGAIDIVVGRMGNQPSQELRTENNFLSDSARIYISQKTDLDKNFAITAGVQTEERSGIGIKADAVRIIGREGIKLVTGAVTGEKNSQGQDVIKVHGIDLIAGNFELQRLADAERVYGSINLQPMVKGHNLLKGLNELVKNVEDLSGLLSTFLVSQMEYNATLALHYHYSPFYAIPTTPSDTVALKGMEVSMKQLKDCVSKMTDFKLNISSFKNNYLIPTSTYYINSKFNRTN